MLFYESSCQDGNFDISQSIFQNNFQIPMQILLSGLTRIFDQPTIALKSLLFKFIHHHRSKWLYLELKAPHELHTNRFIFSR